MIKKTMNGLKRFTALFAVLVMVLSLIGCGQKNEASGGDTAASSVSSATDENASDTEDETAVSDNDVTGAVTEEAADAPDVAGLACTGQMPLKYAECFDVYYYEGGYKLITTSMGGNYLVIPEGMEAPEGLSDDVALLYQPLDKIYLAATSAMALFNAVDGLGNIRFSGTNAGNWYIEAATDAMEAGDILFAGKYSEPDYELLVEEGCDLAVESQMIFHSPKVQEMIEMLDIPVLVDCSSRESHPLGREEWVRMYAALLNKEEAAEDFIADQIKMVEELGSQENTGKTIAFFYISTDGLANVRKSTDYLPAMIELGGGHYIFSDLESDDDDSQLTTVSMSMEDFYATAVNADYIVYNASIDAPLNSVEDLIAKSDLFKDFKAVQEGNVWCTGKDLYQATDAVATMIIDFNLIVNGDDGSNTTFIHKID
ncbi:MAG: ABC transporter substrate-binding protein [Lachnospiraceae bacterium]|nr:ABC transporter substrate-binding protein [Candidatus Equihabitans merdae]